MEFSADWVAIVIAAICNMAIGFIWYSKWLFRDTWLKLIGMKAKEVKGDSKTILSGAIVALLIAYFLEFFERHLGITTVSDGMFLGFCVWLGFVATTQVCSVIWCRKPWKLFFIDTGCKLLSFLVMSGVIGA